MMATMPLFGSMIHWASVSEMTGMLGILTEQNVPIPKALNIASTGLSDADLRKLCGEFAEEVSEGVPLSKLVANTTRLPSTLGPFFNQEVGQENLSKNLSAASRMYFDMADDRAQLVRTILPPVILIAVGGLVTLSVTALISGLQTLVRMASGLTIQWFHIW